MPYMDEAGLARYHDKLRNWAIGARPRRIPSTLYPWTLTEKAGAVTCWPVGGTRLEPAVDFLFTETPPAEGDKGPENPSTISGVSSVKVTRCGKNVLKPAAPESVVKQGVTITTAGDGVYTLNGTSDGQVFHQIGRFGENWFQEGVPYTISSSPSDQNAQFQMWVSNSAYGGGYLGKQSTKTPTKTLVSNVAIYIPAGAVLNNVTCCPQIEYGSQATTFEKGEGEQAALPLGSTYYGGTVDVATGVMTVTYRGLVFTGTENWTNFYTPGTGRIQLSLADYPPYGPQGNFGKCTHYPYIASNTDTSPHITIYSGSDNLLCLYDDFSSLQAFKDFLVDQYNNGAPVTVAYLLKTPYIVQLSPTEILSLTQTDKYTPRLNTIYTDAQAVQVGYVKSPIREEQELTQAIVSQGGNI